MNFKRFRLQFEGLKRPLKFDDQKHNPIKRSENFDPILNTTPERQPNSYLKLVCGYGGKILNDELELHSNSSFSTVLKFRKKSLALF